MVNILDLDVPVCAEHRGGPFDKVRKHRHAERRVGGTQHRDLLRGGRYPALGQVVQTGGADEDRDARRDRSVEARLKRGRG